jgi:2-dehydro-3-deoxyphosphogluconate aldolase/(4S)-4-hydroxy-2-oxoglutarate aldolase
VNVRDLMVLGPVIPVIVLDDPRRAVPMAEALVAGGIRVLEVTLRTPTALEAVRAIAREVNDAIPGVGTVVDPGQLAEARDAGARFAVTPGLTPALARAARESGLPLLPGTMTPSDVVAALAEGYRELKFFPAVPAGGVPMLKALHGPFPDAVFCPTGGVGPANAREFLALPNVACVGGSWLTPRELIAAGDWESIRRLAAEAASLGAHEGPGCQ